MSEQETKVSPAKTARQVLNQCRVVADLARSIALVHEQKSENYSTIDMQPGLIDIVGQQTASFMEQLGDILNAMDACDPADEWMTPIFQVAQATWPRSAA